MFSGKANREGFSQNMMIEKIQKLSFRSPPFLYHGCPVCGKTAASSAPTVLLFVVVMTPMMAAL